jgi:hypothetical protein
MNEFDLLGEFVCVVRFRHGKHYGIPAGEKAIPP